MIRKTFNFVFAIAVLCLGIGMLVVPVMAGHPTRLYLIGGSLLTVVALFWIYEDFLAPSTGGDPLA